MEYFDVSVTLVSPWWLLECWKQHQLVCPSDYPAQLEKRKKMSMDDTAIKKKRDSLNSTEKTSNLLRGYLFVLLRISNPPNWMVDYDAKELEKLVRSNGGQVLSLKLLEALKADQARTSQPHSNNNASVSQGHAQQQQQLQRKIPQRKSCHVICWGGNAGNATAIQKQFALHPLLSQIQRKSLCEIVTATPTWLQTCVLEQKIVDPGRIQQLFQPQSWPWRRLVTLEDKVKSNKNQKIDEKEEPTNGQSHCTIRISVTGFTGHHRTAIIQAIEAIGAIYDDTMRQHITTHLICSDRAVGKSEHNQKFQKAREWGMYLVSVDWLYHVLQLGGIKKRNSRGEDDAGDHGASVDDDFCESQFLVTAEKKLKEETKQNKKLPEG
mgnify:CR=1 FL=1